MPDLVRSYQVGQRPTLRVSIKVLTDGAMALTDPSALTFRMREPDGSLTTYEYGDDTELERESTGIFLVRWRVAQEGVHYYRFYNDEEDSVAEGAAERMFTAERTLFAP
jgi:hypothetical protein